MVNGTSIALTGVEFSIGDFDLRVHELAVRAGEYFVVTGPNGAGKTQLLRLIAGLSRARSGEVRIGARAITNLPPWQRSVGYVPQDSTLFPNRDVRGNISFGLEVRGRSPEQIDAEVERVAEMLGIGSLLARRVQGLSGGEQQKVSLARALIIEPDVLLLDEPVSAIDQQNRDGLCRRLRSVQRELGISTIHVAHNRAEIELVADRFARMDGGRIQTIDTP